MGYKGNCHCGRFRFTVSVPEVTEVMECSCSLCAKMGYLWLAATPTVTRDNGLLVEYDSPEVKHKFCGYCGIGVVGEHRAEGGQPLQRVNARTLLGVNPFKFRIKKLAVATPDGEAPTPAASIESSSVTGTCHCKAVSVELLAPLSDFEIGEDNCSICVRAADCLQNGKIGVHPTKDQVKINGRENTTTYKLGRGWSGNAFCKTCGVYVFGNMYGPPQEFIDGIPEERRERVMAVISKNMAVQSLNVRAFDNVDLASLKIKRDDCGTEGYSLED